MRILVTRPIEQATSLVELLTQQGFDVMLFPAVEIETFSSHPTWERLFTLNHIDHIIAQSSNAVTDLSRRMGKKRMEFLLNRQWIAIGPATQASLSSSGIRCEIIPRSVFSSEGLLTLSCLSRCENKVIVLFQGEGARPFLATELRARNAAVHEIITYRRRLPQSDPTLLQTYLEQKKIAMITVTSLEILRNLILLVGEKHYTPLREIPLIVISDRVAEFAKNIGYFKEVIVAKEARPEAILAVIQERQKELRDDGRIIA